MIDLDSYLSRSNGSGLEVITSEKGRQWCENRDHLVLMIAILDGSDQYAHRYGQVLATRKEQLHYRVCRRMVLSHHGELIDNGREDPFYRDGVLAFFRSADATCDALSAMLSVYRYLGKWNEEHGLGWEEQVHSRAGISTSSWLTTLVLAQQAERQEIILDASDWKKMSKREQKLLTGAANIREGYTPKSWGSLVKSQVQDVWDTPIVVNDKIRNAIESCLDIGPSVPAEEEVGALARSA